MKNRFVVLLLPILFLATPSKVSAQNNDTDGWLFDWTSPSPTDGIGGGFEAPVSQDDFYSFTEYVPVVFASDYAAWNPTNYVFLNTRASQGLPCSIMLRYGTGPLDTVDPSDPFTAGNRPWSLDTYLTGYPYPEHAGQGQLTQLDYILGDFEVNDPKYTTHFLTAQDIEDEMDAIIAKVRGTANPRIKNAWLGNYPYSASYPEMARPLPSDDDGYEGSQYYLHSGLNISEPSCYPRTWAVTYHTSAVAMYWPTVSPNARSAMFWLPLESLSGAARALPAGHKLIPWVNVFEKSPGHDGPVPERSDVLATIEHYRMRGATGIGRLDVYDPQQVVVELDANGNPILDANGNPIPVVPLTPLGVPSGSWLLSYTSDQHRNDIIRAWYSLGDYFGDQVTSFLNLSTTKTTGLEWSGVRYGNHVQTLVSNLGSTSQAATYPSIGWGDLPASSASVPANTHQEFNYTITNLLANSTLDTNAAPWYLITPGAAWSSTGGVNNGPCIVLSGRQFAADYYAPGQCQTQANAAMAFSFSARSNVVGTQFRCGYYYYDANGTNLGAATAGAQVLSTGMSSYEFHFTVPNDSRIRSIAPILYNDSYPTNSSAVIYLDNLVLNFQDDFNLFSNSTFHTGTMAPWAGPRGSWSPSGGLGDGPCLKLVNTADSYTYGVYYYNPGQCATYPNAPMEFKIFARSETAGGQIGYGYYYLDSNGAVIGSAPGTSQTLTTGMTGYTFDFTVPGDPRIKSIEPIFYNVTLTNPIYVDNPSLKPGYIARKNNLFTNPGFDANTTAAPWYLNGLGGAYSATGGTGNGPCLKLSGAWYSAFYPVPCAADGNASMMFSFTASANTAGAQLGCRFYCYDVSGNAVGIVGLAGIQTLTTTATGYTMEFTVPNDSRIKYIEPVLYNERYNGNPSSTDIVYVDDLALFAP